LKFDVCILTLLKHCTLRDSVDHETTMGTSGMVAKNSNKVINTIRAIGSANMTAAIYGHL